MLAIPQINLVLLFGSRVKPEEGLLREVVHVEDESYGGCLGRGENSKKKNSEFTKLKLGQLPPK